MEPKLLTAQNFDAEIAKGSVLVDFYADWCGPCQMLAPRVAQFAAKHPEIKVCRVNVDDDVQLALRFGISSIPFLAYFENGELANRSVGLCTVEEIEQLVNI